VSNSLTQRSRNQTTQHEGHEGHEEKQEEHEDGPFFFVSFPPYGGFFVRFAFFVNFVSGLRLDATTRRNLLRKTRLSGVTV